MRITVPITRSEGKLAGVLFLLASIVVALPSQTNADESEKKGLAIAREMDQRSRGFIGLTVKLRMELRNQAGKTSVRYLRSETLEGKNGVGDKSLIIFDRPTDVKGTALLTHARVNDVDDQWMYLPELKKRVKRIAAGNRAGSFMGSEFSYEDLAPPIVDKFTYRYLGDEHCEEGLVCYMNERRSTDESSGYSRQLVWIDHKEYRPWKIEYFDRKDELLKTLLFHNYKLHEKRFWRAHTMKMLNHQTGKSTTLYWSRFHFGVVLREGRFTSIHLHRVR